MPKLDWKKFCWLQKGEWAMVSDHDLNPNLYEEFVRVEDLVQIEFESAMGCDELSVWNLEGKQSRITVRKNNLKVLSVSDMEELSLFISVSSLIFTGRFCASCERFCCLMLYSTVLKRRFGSTMFNQNLAVFSTLQLSLVSLVFCFFWSFQPLGSYHTSEP